MKRFIKKLTALFCLLAMVSLVGCGPSYSISSGGSNCEYPTYCEGETCNVFIHRFSYGGYGYCETITNDKLTDIVIYYNMVYDQNEKLITAKDFNFASEFGQEWYDSLLSSLLAVEEQDPLTIRQLMNNAMLEHVPAFEGTTTVMASEYNQAVIIRVEEGLLAENVEIARKFQVNKFVNKIEFVITGLK